MYDKLGSSYSDHYGKLYHAFSVANIILIDWCPALLGSYGLRLNSNNSMTSAGAHLFSLDHYLLLIFD
jgi:hypothetical protein